MGLFTGAVWVFVWVLSDFILDGTLQKFRDGHGTEGSKVDENLILLLGNPKGSEPFSLETLIGHEEKVT